MVLGRLGNGARAVGGRVRPSGRVGLAAGLLVAVLLAAAAAFVLGLDPLGGLAVFTALFAGDALITGVVLTAAGAVGAVGLVLSRFVGASRKVAAGLTAGGAAAGGAAAASFAGATGAFSGAGLLALGGSALVTLAVDYPPLTALIGGTVVFYIAEPLSRFGAFGSALSKALLAVAAALVAYLFVTLLGSDIRAAISIVPLLAVPGGARRG